MHAFLTRNFQIPTSDEIANKILSKIWWTLFTIAPRNSSFNQRNLVSPEGSSAVFPKEWGRQCNNVISAQTKTASISAEENHIFWTFSLKISFSSITEESHVYLRFVFRMSLQVWSFGWRPAAILCRAFIWLFGLVWLVRSRFAESYGDWFSRSASNIGSWRSSPNL